MLHETEKDQIRASVEALREGMEGFRTRRAQLEMIGTIANALAEAYETDDRDRRGRSIAVVEAGTGTGKTVGYLVPALVLARSRGKRLVVSSSTVALQAQLAGKDVPALQALMPQGFRYALAKGRGRYACIAKLADRAQEASQQEIPLGSEGSKSARSADAARSLEVLVALAAQFEEGTWCGDRDALKTPIADAVWDAITTDRQGCAGNKCPQFARCPFYAARQEIKQADLVIANHDLVLSALRLDSPGLLPDPSETFYVFDEAHNLTRKAVDHFAARHSIRGAQEWIRDLAQVARDIGLGLTLDARCWRDTPDNCSQLAQHLDELYRAIDATAAFEEKPARRLKNGELPAWMRCIGENIEASARSLLKIARGLREAMLERAQAEAQLVQRLLSELGFYLVRLENLAETWALLLLDDAKEGGTTARWIEKHQSAQGHADYWLCASPLSAGERLSRLLWQRASGAVLTSATLTACGSFDLFREQCGLRAMPEAQFLRVGSPFDYAARAQLVVPRMASDPKDAAAHTAELVALLPGLAHTRGTLMLFASGRQMRAVFAGLPSELQQVTTMQGSLPKMEIVARHKAAIDGGKKSVIFGLASFAEGVDLPGEYCTHVIIAKIPFAVPDTPLEEARREWVERQGRSAFVEITLPEAGIRLAQGVGRLLRTHDDHGTVTILDSRLARARWGRTLLRGLPPFALKIDEAPTKQGLKNANKARA